MIYLASPYTYIMPRTGFEHLDLRKNANEVEEQRYEAAKLAVVRLMRQGHSVFSPIVHTHVIAKDYQLPSSVDFWWEFNLPFLRAASEVKVLTLDGWIASKGVRQEIDFAHSIGTPVSYMDADGPASL